MQTATATIADPTDAGAPATLVHTPQSAAPLATTSRAVLMRQYLAEEAEIRGLVKQFIGSQMSEGDDYGVIPGTNKPTLLKPGAEKLVALFNVEPHFEVTNRIEQWEGSGLFHYELTVHLKERSTGIVRAVGLGSANSREGRYRWRNGERLCPSCGKATIIKGKEEYGGGFVCFAKKGGCGAKFRDDDAAITEQQVGKVENDDTFTLVNTILKMAKKRALVDGAIALARCSDIFTQDVEDLGDHLPEDRSVKPRGAQQPQRASKPESKPTAKEPKRPLFSKNAKWSGAEQWAGKPLDTAPLDALREYFEAYRAAHEACEDARIGLMMREHIGLIEAAMASKEPRVEPDTANGEAFDVEVVR